MIAMLLILILILLVVMLNIYVLRYQTVHEIDTTLNDQAKDNMQLLVRENSVYMHSKITEITAMFGLIQEMLIGMEDESTFSLDYLLSYTPSQLPEKCWVYDVFHQKVCATYSSYTNYTEDFDNDFLRKISRFDNIWPSVLKLTANIALRYYLYFPAMGILKNFPGMALPLGYSPNNTEWYKSFKDNKSSISATTAYEDSLGTGQAIISLMYPLVDSNNSTIGLIVADVPLSAENYLFSGIYSVSYLKTGFTSVAYKNGTLMDTDSSFWKPYTNINEISEFLWKNMTDFVDDNHFFIFHDNVYRLANYPVGVDFYQVLNSSQSNWYYMMMLIVEENDVMEYRDDSKTKISNAGVLLVIITIVCSGITIAVVTVLIHFLAKSITAPLKGIIDFTNKINARATEKDMVTKDELNDLKEGDDQVAELVRTFKQLAGSLITKQDDRIPKPLQISQNRVFPRNEFYQKNKLEWKKLIDSLPE